MKILLSSIIILLSFSVFGLNKDKKTMESMSDLKIVEKIEGLPSISLSYYSEEGILENLKEVSEVLKKENHDPKIVFKSIVAFNKPSKVTNESYHFYFIVSLEKKIVLKEQGDDIWLIKNGKGKLSDELRGSLLGVLK